MGLIAAIINAGAEAASGDSQGIEQAEQNLAGLQTEATKAGFVDRQLEARLAAGQIGLAGSHAIVTRAELQELLSEARHLPFARTASPTCPSRMLAALFETSCPRFD